MKPDGNLHCASWETNKTLHIRQDSVRGIYSCRTPDMSVCCAEGKVERRDEERQTTSSLPTLAEHAEYRLFGDERTEGGSSSSLFLF